MARALMIQGTASHCGKTLCVAAFCKIFADAGYRVAPFKSQNMSLNSYVTKKGEEISRAQALQAFAAGIEPTADMNPILLKPKGEWISQIVFHGTPYRDVDIRYYFKEFALTDGLRGVEDSYRRLIHEYDPVVIEGAGSPAEINFYDFEIANMRIADMADAPVILVADIERGGVFASIVGTLNLLRKEHRKRVKGLVINKFRGDASLLEPGLKQVEQITGKPVLGVIPYIQDLELPVEDSVSLEEKAPQTMDSVDVAIIRLPKISNFTDFDPLKSLPGISIRYVLSAEAFGSPDAIILPGTKNTVRDLMWLKNSGLADKVTQSAAQGIPVIGICGGYQMLGKTIVDESEIEGGIGSAVDGLALLNIVTRFDEYRKTTNQVKAEVVAGGMMLNSARGAVISGYEIHMGKTKLGEHVKPVFKIISEGEKPVKRYDGAIEEQGIIFGTYVHGVFDNPPVRQGIVTFLLRKKNVKPTYYSGENIQDIWRKSLIRLAQITKESLDMTKIYEIVGLPQPRC